MKKSSEKKKKRTNDVNINQGHKRLTVVLICAALALVTFTAYEQVRNHGFIDYDDDVYVYKNQHVKAGFTPDSIKWAFTTRYASNWHPLTWLSHMLDCQLFGNNPGLHHLTNLLIHIASTLLLFAVFKRMTGAIWRSAFIAAAFALHPLHVESVAWIAERKDVLSGLFWILTMWAYVRYTERTGVNRYMLMLLFFILGLMAKPMVVTLPFVLLLLDYWPLNRTKWTSKNMGKNALPCEAAAPKRRIFSTTHLILEKLPLFFTSAAVCIITYIAQRGGGTVVSTVQLPLKFRMVTAMTSYFNYLVKIFYPVNLAVYYPHTKIFTFRIVIMILLLVLLVLFIRRVKSRPWLTVGLLWYIGTLVPVIGLVKVGSQVMADRYTYLPSIGIFIIVAWGIAEITSKLRYHRIVRGISAGLVFTALFICTRVQITYWQNNAALFSHALEVANSAIMHEKYATAVLEEGKFDEAINYYRQALHKSPNLVQAHAGLGIAFLRQGKMNEAAKCFEKALSIRPDYPLALNYLGTLLEAQGKSNEAIENFNRAIRSDPDFLSSYCNAAKLKAQQKEYVQAIKYYEEALKRKPDWPEVCSELAEVYSSLGKKTEAVFYWHRALELDPDNIRVLNNLTWILATAEDKTIRKPSEAVEYAKRLSELVGSNQQPMFLDTIAAAYAAAGDFTAAVDTIRQAIKLVESEGKQDLADELRFRLELYKSGQPYIQK